jgi:repressor LexA
MLLRIWVLAKRARSRTETSAKAIPVPLLGRIVAGVPTPVMTEYCGTLNLSVDLIGSSEHFALEVTGDSMIDAGILHGDTIIVRRQEAAKTGDIVVAHFVEEDEAMLARLGWKGMSIMLEAANPAYETRICSLNRVRIQGSLVGLLRKY